MLSLRQPVILLDWHAIVGFNARGRLSRNEQHRLLHFTQGGCKFEYSKHFLRIIPNEILNSVNITTDPFPGFPTDLQAPFMALMATANGTSQIKETIFENRMHHVKELNRMGAKITVRNNIANVIGVKKLQGREVMGSDLRATAALAIAGLSANGKTIVNIVIKNKNKKATYSLQNNRKFDLKHLKALKAKDYVAKITV